jgi:hypothetical protein
MISRELNVPLRKNWGKNIDFQCGRVAEPGLTGSSSAASRFCTQRGTRAPVAGFAAWSSRTGAQTTGNARSVAGSISQTGDRHNVTRAGCASNRRPFASTFVPSQPARCTAGDWRTGTTCRAVRPRQRPGPRPRSVRGVPVLPGLADEQASARSDRYDSPDPARSDPPDSISPNAELLPRSFPDTAGPHRRTNEPTDAETDCRPFRMQAIFEPDDFQNSECCISAGGALGCRRKQEPVPGA